MISIIFILVCGMELVCLLQNICDAVHDMMYLKHNLFILRFMYELLAKANIVYGNKNIVVDALDKMVAYITSDGESHMEMCCFFVSC